ncbi:CDP-alcohol phosphatidyltransferase family protein [Alkalicoccobacillus gibsonii]|uniref:CDP-alcohol phosphatidyltransferase family protein n=1 Tax=Alkalicoccobacillus gibsonii TaxID=79881 RepID=UPI0035147783
MSSEKLTTFFFDSDQILELRRQVQPYSPKEDLWSWYVLRRMSIYITLLFRKMNLSPNTVSWMSVFFVLLSGLCMILSTPTSFILAFIAYNIGYLFDCVDGELARLTRKISKLGYFIDMLIRAATLPVFLSFLTTLLMQTGGLTLTTFQSIILYLVIVCIIMSLLLPLSYDLTFAMNVQVDPVQKIRNKSFLFEFSGFILGLPGFYLLLVIFTVLELIFNITITQYLISGFLLLLMVKVVLRAIITVRTFKHE